MFKRILMWFARRFILPYVDRVDLRAKCPACGRCKKHKIAFAQEYGAIIHSCSACGALWGQKPVVNWTDWKVSIHPVSGQEVKSNVMDIPPIMRRAK